jgi:short-subunit dehydrogenase
VHARINDAAVDGDPTHVTIAMMMRPISNYVITQIVNSSGRRSGKALAITGASIGLLLAGRAVMRRRRRYDLMRQTVLITGGSRGLGLVMAREFVRQGARVAICARDSEELERASQDLMLRGGEVFPVSCDLTDQMEVERLVRKIQEEFGEIDVLVNNAGVISVGPIEEMTIGDFEEAMRTNYWAAVYTILALLPRMLMRREGRIINIASIGAKISVPHLLPYCASKFALMGLSAGLRAELAKDGIVVTTVCPGLMRTGSPRNATFKGNHRAEYTWFSISDSLPLVSMSAERAARQIITACKRGDAEVVLSLPAKLAVGFQALFPGLTADLLGVVNQLLPPPGGIGAERARGSESESSLSPSFLTSLGDKAARENNQLGRA